MYHIFTILPSDFFINFKLMTNQPDYHIELMKYIEKHNYKPKRDDTITLDNGVVIEKCGRVSDNYRKKYPDYKEFYDNKFSKDDVEEIFYSLKNGTSQEKTKTSTKIKRHFNNKKLLDINLLADDYDIKYLKELKKAVDEGYKFENADDININTLDDDIMNDEVKDNILNTYYGKKDITNLLFKYIDEHHEELKDKSTITARTMIDKHDIGREHIRIRNYIKSSVRNNCDDRIVKNYTKLLDYYDIKFEGINMSYFELAKQYKDILIRMLNENVDENKQSIINFLNSLFEYIIENDRYPENGSQLYKEVLKIYKREIKYTCLTDKEMNILYDIIFYINKAYSNKQNF